MESETQIKIKKNLKKVVLLTPSIILISYIFIPAIKTVAGITLFSFYGNKQLILAESPKKTNRNVQKFFRKFDTAIDLNDIIDAGYLRREKSLPHPLTGCLEASQIVYVPIKFRLPYYGIEVLEWCLILKK